MNWVFLIVAGLLECCWAIGLKYTEGFTRPMLSVVVVLAILASMGLLGLALRTVPVGTGYAIWVGIGVLGTSIAGIMLFKEPATFARIVFLALLGVSIIGLKLTSP